MSHKQGDKVVYGSHGVCVVKRIETSRYVLDKADGGMTIMVPRGAAESLIRPIVTEQKARTMLKLASEPLKGPARNDTWHRRYRANLEQLQTGYLEGAVTVYRELRALQVGKDLSFGERKMLDHARTLIATEVAAALNTSEEAILWELAEVTQVS